MRWPYRLLCWVVSAHQDAVRLWTDTTAEGREVEGLVCHFCGASEVRHRQPYLDDPWREGLLLVIRRKEAEKLREIAKHHGMNPK